MGFYEKSEKKLQKKKYPLKIRRAEKVTGELRKPCRI